MRSVRFCRSATPCSRFSTSLRSAFGFLLLGLTLALVFLRLLLGFALLRLQPLGVDHRLSEEPQCPGDGANFVIRTGHNLDIEITLGHGIDGANGLVKRPGEGRAHNEKRGYRPQGKSAQS